MDAIRFDDLTKAWIAEASRRRTLAGLFAGALGASALPTPTIPLRPSPAGAGNHAASAQCARRGSAG